MRVFFLVSLKFTRLHWLSKFCTSMGALSRHRRVSSPFSRSSSWSFYIRPFDCMVSIHLLAFLIQQIDLIGFYTYQFDQQFGRRDTACVLTCLNCRLLMLSQGAFLFGLMHSCYVNKSMWLRNFLLHVLKFLSEFTGTYYLNGLLVRM